MPALQATRPDLSGGMKQGSAGAGAGRVRHRMRTVLVVTEVALAFVLLTGAGLLLRSFARLQNVDTGFADQTIVDRANRKACFFKMVSPSYFRAISLKLIRGRSLTKQDTAGTPPVTVISDAMAKKYFGDEDPIGKRILIQEIAFGKPSLGEEIPWEVVGIVADEKVGSLSDKEGTPGVYVTIEQSPQLHLSLLIRSEIDPALLHQALRTTVKEINPDQTMPEMKTLEQIKTESLGANRLNTILLAIFGAVALLLAAIGIYGVMAYSVVQRTREIGIRAALGATASDILHLVLRHGMTTVVLGLLIGIAGIFALSRLLSTLIFGVGERDPVTIVSVALLLAGVALIACYLPAQRATKVNPIVALREE
jgi:putative ABC transport system permease protein